MKSRRFLFITCPGFDYNYHKPINPPIFVVFAAETARRLKVAGNLIAAAIAEVCRELHDADYNVGLPVYLRRPAVGKLLELSSGKRRSSGRNLSGGNDVEVLRNEVMSVEKIKNPNSMNFPESIGRKILSAFCLLLTAAFLTPEIFAQVDETDPKGKTMVSVPVSVSDRDGRYIAGLEKNDFSIYQDGVKQKISFFAKYDEPLNIVLLLDTSGSTGASLQKIKEGAGDFIGLLNDRDRCLIATFDSKINLLSAFSSDRKILKDSLDRAQTANTDGTLMRSAVLQIAQKSFGAGEGRKVIVLLSDGKDRGSRATRDELVGYLEESDILIYTIFYKSGEGFQKLVIDENGNVAEGVKPKKEKKPQKPQKPKKPKGYVLMIPGATAVPTNEEIKRRELDSDAEGVAVLRDISETTAGRFYLSGTIDLGDTFKKVAAELRQQYRLGFFAKNAPGTARHDIVVKVEREGAAVQTRGKFKSKL